MFVFYFIKHQHRRSKIKQIFPLLILGILLLAILSSCDSSPPPPADKTHAENNSELSKQIADRLRAAGWTHQAAVAVSDLNKSYFSILAEYPERLDTVLQRLERLGRYENLALMPRLERHPELAALYAGATVPMELDRAFISEDCLGVYSGMFQLIIDSHEQRILADAFRRHGSIICALGEQGVPAPATLFMFDINRLGASEYARWLEEALTLALRSSQSEENLTEIIALALDQGELLRERLAEDAEFRRLFRSQLWPAFMRVTDCSDKTEGDCHTSFDLLANNPRVWEVLIQDRGEELLQSGGLQAIDLLTDSPDGKSFPQDLRHLVTEALLKIQSFETCNQTSDQIKKSTKSNDELDGYNLICALIRFQKEPLFRQLMLRENIDPDLRQRILADLIDACPKTTPQCPDLEKRLRALIGFSLSTLREDLGPKPEGFQTWAPFYDTYYVVKKLAQGRDVSASEIAFATLDFASIVGLGAGGKMLTQTLKRGGKTLARDVAESVAKNSSKRAMRSYNKDLIEQTAKQGQLMTAVAKHYFKSVIEIKKSIEKSIDKFASFEITKPLQWIFTKTGTGRVSMKKITGLEARVFMRQDSRITISLNKGISGELLSETFINAAFNQADDVVYDAASALAAWKEHASVWWFETQALAH